MEVSVRGCLIEMPSPTILAWVPCKRCFMGGPSRWLWTWNWQLTMSPPSWFTGEKVWEKKLMRRRLLKRLLSRWHRGWQLERFGNYKPSHHDNARSKESRKRWNESMKDLASRRSCSDIQASISIIKSAIERMTAKKAHEAMINEANSLNIDTIFLYHH